MSSSGPARAPNGKLRVGLDMQKSDTADVSCMAQQSWCNVDGTSFDTRIGPDYSQNKRKDSSQPCIYECAAIDLYETDSKIRSAASEGNASLLAPRALAAC